MFNKRTIASGIINGLVASVGAFMAVATGLSDNASIGDISSLTWSIIVATGLSVALKDMQAYLKKPEE